MFKSLEVLRTRMVRHVVAWLTTFVVVGSFLSVVMVSVADATSTSTPTDFILALGASASVGFQPTLSHPHGEPTNRGYANDLLNYETQRGLSVQLTKLGCPGASTGSMISGSDGCNRGGPTQLAQARAFLAAHAYAQGIVTIDLGFNNVARCLRYETVDVACARHQLELVKQQLPLILASLQSVAGEGVTFVGVGHYDPYLADALQGANGQRFANESYQIVSRLNFALQDIYAKAGIAMAVVANTFQSRDFARVKTADTGTIRDNVAHACELTWMCQPAPYGPNLHPNDAGYAAIAQAIEDVLRAPW